VNDDRLRFLVLAAALGLVAVKEDLPSKLLGKPKPVAVADDYTGPLTRLHAAAVKMAPEHRAAMAEAFNQGADSVRDDNTGLIATTRQWQRAMEGILQFAYRDGGRIDTRYPDVALAIQEELSRVAGGEEVRITDRQRFIDCPRNLAAAVK